MYFVGLYNGQVIILNYYMLNIMFHLLNYRQWGKCLAYTMCHFMYENNLTYISVRHLSDYILAFKKHYLIIELSIFSVSDCYIYSIKHS